MDKIIIFGAQGYALGTYKAIKTVYPNKEIICFLVSKVGGLDPESLEGLPVRELAPFSALLSDEEKKETEIIIATPENIQPEIEALLDGFGLINHSRLTASRWDELNTLYHEKLGRFKPLKAMLVDESVVSETSFSIKKCNSEINIYMAKFFKDKVLKDNPVLPDYMIPIQVGAELTDVRVADVLDNHGENISKKNVNYCETTALYWMWKNRLEDKLEDDVKYFGLAQYRRMFTFTDEDIRKIFANDVDVVLPYPMPYAPDINAHHNRYLKDVDWNAMLTALREISPEYADAFTDILKQQFMYNYNVILAKKDVLRDYCAWLFPILERTEELSEPKGCDRADRYIGYMAETLETLYFIYNADRFKIAHACCKLFS